MSSKDLKPKLRFPQFKDAWTSSKLGDVTNKVEKRNREKEILPVYSISNKYGFIHQSEQFEGMDSIERGFDTTQYKIVDNNTFAYNPARINVGSIGYNENLGVVLLSSLYVCFKTKDFIDDTFFWQFLNTNQFANEVLSKGEGGVRIYLFYENFATIKFAYPKIEEQQKIASFINTVDKKLNALIEKQNLLQEYKRGLLKKILNKEVKLKDEKGKEFAVWVSKTVEEVCECLDNQRKPFNGSERSKIQGDIPYWGANRIMDYINDFIFDEPIVLLAEDGGNFEDYTTKSIANLSYGKCWVNNHTHVLKGKKGLLLTEFLYYSLVHKDIRGFVSGGTRSKLTKSSMMQIKISLPSLAEQQKISSFFISLDKKIDAIETQIKNTTNYKKALMQQMFC